MNFFKYIIDLGTEKQNDVTCNKHIRFTNSLGLIICCFLIQNIILSIYYEESLIAFIQLVHLLMIALIFLFNHQGRRVLASAWFSSAAIFFVTIYSIIFTLEGFNFAFLPMLIFLQFFLFSPAEKKYIILFVTAAFLCLAGVLIVISFDTTLGISVSQDLINAQHWNNLAGLPILSAAMGAYAFFTIKKADEELAKEKDDLKTAQKQLIQSEKMASLGELTAGIAHEIQNPLNFVNNFSEVNTELIDEMQQEMNKGNLADAKEISNDIKENEQKINHHGKRAGDIVKGMLQHSRSSTGVKEPTDINALADEYLRLSYHGLRAKDKTFNATMKKDFDESIGKINIIPQDIGRVLLNLYNNAFYACTERSRSAVNEQKSENLISDGKEVTPFQKVSPLYEPTVSVTTKKSGNHVIITVSDNGNGIPQNIVDKIFQPFFTTKPTRQGTGLGLSLSYDMVKAHGGYLKVESLSDEATAQAGNEGQGTKFIISLPAA